MTLEQLKTTIDDYFNDDVSRLGKKQHQVFMRWIYYKLAKKHFKKASLEKIGSVINKDHTCVLYGLRNFDYEYDTNESFQFNYDSCDALFKEFKSDLKLTKHNVLSEIFKLPKKKIELFEKEIAEPFLLTHKNIKNG